jgi:hypothetical protein
VLRNICKGLQILQQLPSLVSGPSALSFEIPNVIVERVECTLCASRASPRM